MNEHEMDDPLLADLNEAKRLFNAVAEKLKKGDYKINADMMKLGDHILMMQKAAIGVHYDDEEA